jgi:hypothetical protein
LAEGPLFFQRGRFCGRFMRFCVKIAFFWGRGRFLPLFCNFSVLNHGAGARVNVYVSKIFFRGFSQLSPKACPLVFASGARPLRIEAIVCAIFAGILSSRHPFPPAPRLKGGGPGLWPSQRAVAAGRSSGPFQRPRPQGPWRERFFQSDTTLAIKKGDLFYRHFRPRAALREVVL